MESNTIKYFKELSKIPRESGNEEEIANYIVRFAVLHHLEYEKDIYHNVIIKKYVKDKQPIIFQCHLDMVCEKDPEIDFDFTKDPIHVIEEDGYLKADKTTLGADNGIGIAMLLNILDSNLPISIEAIFTSSEETTMEGAENIDIRSLRGKEMINLDGFESDTIVIESASFTDIDIHLNYQFERECSNLYQITLTGLKGGHSGFDIDTVKENSSLLLANLLLTLENVQIASFHGGTKINVIPATAEAILTTSDDIQKRINDYQKSLPRNVQIVCQKVDQNLKTLSITDSALFLNSLIQLKHGVLNKNHRKEVTTSENLAIVDLSQNLIRVGLRSSIEEEREQAIKYLESISTKYHYHLMITGYQLGFKTDEDAKLVHDLVKAYEEVDHQKPSIHSLHIAVEAGILKAKLPYLEVAIISPKIIGAHSTLERVEIESIKKCDEWLNQYLRQQL